VTDFTVRPLKTVANDNLMDRIRNDASLDYQRRVPDATQAGIQATVKALTEYRPAFNEFVDSLVNRIGSVVARNISWTNPLAEFKRGMLQYGDTIEEIQSGLVKAHTYDPDRDEMEKSLFGTEIPEVQTNFHRVNRQNYYKVSVNESLLMRAFLETNGLSQFISQLMVAPMTSDYWDEFLVTCQLFSEYESQGGFYHVHVPDVADLSSNAEDAKGALRRMRAMADTLKFVSTKYNAAKMPSFATAEELVLFVTPEFNAAIDVEALAGAFNISKAEMTGRVIPIPKENFAINGAQAIMTVRDFFVIADSRLENTAQYNPVSLNTNYFLHHWEVVSASRFVPAVLFHTGADDEVIQISTPISGISAVVVQDIAGTVVTEVTRGLIYQATAAGVTTPAGGDNDVVRWSLTGANSPKTYVTSTGVLHVGETETSTALSLKATTTWLDPSNVRLDGQVATAALTIVGSGGVTWPEQGVVTGISVRDVGIPAFVATTFAYASPVPKPIEADDIVVYSQNSGSLKVSVNAAGTIGTVTFDGGVGAAVTYTITAS